MVKVGVLGGTFDPVHNGHLRIAEEARLKQGLSKVYFVPAAQPWMKGRTISPAEHRLEMIRLAIWDKAYLELSYLDMNRAGPTYTIDTITDLRGQLSSQDEIYFILGWDSLSMFPKWRQASRIIDMCYLLVVPRPGYPLPDIKALEDEIPGISRRVIFMEGHEVDISATGIRRRISHGLSIDHLVPQSVDRYIREHHLYLNQEESSGAEGGI